MYSLYIPTIAPSLLPYWSCPPTLFLISPLLLRKGEPLQPYPSIPNHIRT